MVVSAVVAAAGALTCCALFLVLAIPYVGTVVLLPVYVTARAFGPEFLAQFGPEFETWPAADPAPDPEPLPEAPEDSDPPQD